MVALLESRTAPDAVAALRAQGVLATAMDGRTLRLTTHHDVSAAECARAAEILPRALA